MKQRLGKFINNPTTDLAVAVLILLSIALLLAEFSELLSSETFFIVETAGHTLTGLFIVELTIRWYTASNRKLFWRKYWIDIIAVIPFIQELRVFRLLRVLRIFSVGKLLNRSNNAFRFLFSQRRSETMVIGVLIFVMVVIVGFSVHVTERGDTDFDQIGESFWWAFLSMIAGEPIGGTPTSTTGKMLMVITMLSGLTIFAMFTGLVSAIMVKRLRSDMEIKEMEISELSGQMIICGWNRQALHLLREFAADPYFRDVALVLIGEYEDDSFLDDLPVDREQTYIIKGDPTTVDALERAGVRRAQYAILLADKLAKRSDQDRDARTILTALTIEKMNPSIYTVAELLSREGTDHLKLAGVEEVIVGDEISSNLIATSLRNKGLLAVLQELFTARFGCQFYKDDVPRRLVGKTFEETLHTLKTEFDVLPVSIERKEGDTTVHITNPALDLVLQPGDRLVMISRNCPDLGE